MVFRVGVRPGTTDSFAVPYVFNFARPESGGVGVEEALARTQDTPDLEAPGPWVDP